MARQSPCSCTQPEFEVDSQISSRIELNSSFWHLSFLMSDEQSLQLLRLLVLLLGRGQISLLSPLLSLTYRHFQCFQHLLKLFPQHLFSLLQYASALLPSHHISIHRNVRLVPLLRRFHLVEVDRTSSTVLWDDHQAPDQHLCLRP